jgi:hypothetical protein
LLINMDVPKVSVKVFLLGVWQLQTFQICVFWGWSGRGLGVVWDASLTASGPYMERVPPHCGFFCATALSVISTSRLDGYGWYGMVWVGGRWWKMVEDGGRLVGTGCGLLGTIAWDCVGAQSIMNRQRSRSSEVRLGS